LRNRKPIFERLLHGLARRDSDDRGKSLLIACAGVRKVLLGRGQAAGRHFKYINPFRGSWEGYPKFAPISAEPAYIESCLRLLEYTFPARTDSIGIIGASSHPLLNTLECHGYRNVKAIDLDAGLVVQGHSRVCLFNVLERIPRARLDAFVKELAGSASDWLVASIPTYPESLFDFYDHDPARVAFERREWWNALFERHGFEPRPPRETLPHVESFLFQKKKHRRTKAKAAKPSGQITDLVIALPDEQNAFRWVSEALAEAVTNESVPARVSLPADWTHDTRQAGCTLTWAHYWSAYREPARKLNPDMECFVTNFSFERTRELTPWLDELCTRPSRKITPSAFAKSALVNLGVPAGDIEIVPHGYSPEFVDRPAPLPLATEKSFRFLAVVNSYDPYRYGMDLLLDAYRKAFATDDDVCLVMKDYGPTTALTRRLLEQELGPEILYYSNFMSKEDLAAFYAATSALVAPFRGEGFGMKIIDAAAMGLPVIVPLYGGPRDYCPPDLVWAVEHSAQPVGRCLETDELSWNEQLIWCEVDVDDLAAKMRHVYENQETARERADRHREYVVQNFTWRAAAQTLIRWMDLS